MRSSEKMTRAAEDLVATFVNKNNNLGARRGLWRAIATWTWEDVAISRSDDEIDAWSAVGIAVSPCFTT